MLPQTNQKLHPNRRSSFYQKERKPIVRPFKSHLEPDFNAGCNDDLISLTSSITGEANSSVRDLQKETRNWRLKQERDVTSKIDQLCTVKHQLKRAPLPKSIT